MGMKKSVIARGKLAKAMVLRGSKVKTSGGLKKGNLRKNKAGRIVSKAASDRAKKAYAGSAIQKWTKAVQQARKELNLKGMVFVGGKTAPCMPRRRRSTRREGKRITSRHFFCVLHS